MLITANLAWAWQQHARFFVLRVGDGDPEDDGVMVDGGLENDRNGIIYEFSSWLWRLEASSRLVSKQSHASMLIEDCLN